MRAWFLAMFGGLFATAALAENAVISDATFHQRMNSCVVSWKEIPSADRGPMTYRQYTTKCLSGKTASPLKSLAQCQNGVTAPATSPEGACANDGGVAHWVN
jgi:hypothetical protein